jgi:hypothetical protein
MPPDGFDSNILPASSITAWKRRQTATGALIISFFPYFFNILLFPQGILVICETRYQHKGLSSENGFTQTRRDTQTKENREHSRIHEKALHHARLVGQIHGVRRSPARPDTRFF